MNMQVSRAPETSRRQPCHEPWFQDVTLPKFPVDRNMIRMLVDLVGERPRVLDAGCGAGQVTKMLQNWGCDAVGVDAAEKLFAV